MTATDELRRMLAEAGVEWEAPESYDGSTKYDTVVDDYWFHEYDGRITVHGLAPEQAIAATVKRWTCHIKEVASYGYPFECSECKAWHGVNILRGELRFCPNCGAEVVDE